MKMYVYDIETYPNIFTFVFKEVSKEKELKIFEISSRKDDTEELISFLKQPQIQIGYNNLNFDYPILHFILKNPKLGIKEWYNKVNSIINGGFPIYESDFIISQIDLFKIWHYDNPARSTSLKWLEFTLRWKKVKDLPFIPGTIIPENEFDNLINYNINDVDFTLYFLGKSLDKIRFRERMGKKLNHRVMNYSDVKIGEYINRITYQKLSGIPYHDFKDLRTYRDIFQVKDLIPDFIKFKTKYLQDFLEEIRTKSFKSTDKFEMILMIGNLNLKFAKGGIHSNDSPKLLKCKEGWKLKEKDVGSMYSASIINGKLYPEHLGEQWYMGIKSLYDDRVFRIKPKMKELDKNSDEYFNLNSEQESIKLALNGGGFGKTGSEYSWQYDPMVVMKTTFKGQLCLLMLMEEFNLNGIELISANTDGVVIHYPEDKEEIVTKIHKEWEKITGYVLEDTSYNKIVFSSVNDYLAEIIDEKTKKRIKIKYKGDMEFDCEYHKNNSQRIVPIALNEYFINNVPIRDVIMNIGYEFINSKGEKEKTTIFDYCIGKKSNNKVNNYSLVGSETKPIKDKVIRYYISNSNEKLVKVYESGKKEAVNKGFNHTLIMNYEKKDNYNIDFYYYINECEKIINPILRGTNQIKNNYKESEQLNLF